MGPQQSTEAIGDESRRHLALAFFPNEPKERKRVFVNPSYYDPALEYGRVGVFRHEHIGSGAPPECPQEAHTGTIASGNHDPKICHALLLWRRGL